MDQSFLDHFILVFDDKVAFQLTDGLILGRCHNNEQNLTYYAETNKFCLSINTLSKEHAKFENNTICVLGSNRTALNTTELPRNQPMPLHSGELTTRTAFICRIYTVRELLLYIYQQQYKNLQKLLFLDNIDVLSPECAEMLNQTHFSTLALDFHYYSHYFTSHKQIDLDLVKLIKIPPFDADFTQLTSFSCFSDIQSYLLQKCEIQNFEHYLRQQTPLQLFRLKRNNLFTGYSRSGLKFYGFSTEKGENEKNINDTDGSNSNGNTNVVPNSKRLRILSTTTSKEKSIDFNATFDVSENILKLMIIFADTRQLENLKKPAASNDTTQLEVSDQTTSVTKMQKCAVPAKDSSTTLSENDMSNNQNRQQTNIQKDQLQNDYLFQSKPHLQQNMPLNYNHISSTAEQQNNVNLVQSTAYNGVYNLNYLNEPLKIRGANAVGTNDITNVTSTTTVAESAILQNRAENIQETNNMQCQHQPYNKYPIFNDTLSLSSLCTDNNGIQHTQPENRQIHLRFMSSTQKTYQQNTNPVQQQYIQSVIKQEPKNHNTVKSDEISSDFSHSSDSSDAPFNCQSLPKRQQFMGKLSFSAPEYERNGQKQQIQKNEQNKNFQQSVVKMSNNHTTGIKLFEDHSKNAQSLGSNEDDIDLLKDHNLSIKMKQSYCDLTDNCTAEQQLRQHQNSVQKLSSQLLAAQQPNADDVNFSSLSNDDNLSPIKLGNVQPIEQYNQEHETLKNANNNIFQSQTQVMQKQLQQQQKCQDQQLYNIQQQQQSRNAQQQQKSQQNDENQRQNTDKLCDIQQQHYDTSQQLLSNVQQQGKLQNSVQNKTLNVDSTNQSKLAIQAHNITGEIAITDLHSSSSPGVVDTPVPAAQQRILQNQVGNSQTQNIQNLDNLKLNSGKINGDLPFVASRSPNDTEFGNREFQQKRRVNITQKILSIADGEFLEIFDAEKKIGEMQVKIGQRQKINVVKPDLDEFTL